MTATAAATSQQHLWLLDALVQPTATALGLRHLVPNAALTVASTLFFWFVHVVAAPMLSRAVAPQSYAALRTKRDRNNWNNRVASFAHALVVCSLALHLLLSSSSSLMSTPSRFDRVFGHDPRVETMSSIACGYFIWDLFESMVHYESPAFALHAFSCLFIYFLSFKPCMQYYAPRFILWELTLFLNIHWFCDKVNMTGSTLQFINGIVLLATFAVVRLVYGTIQSYDFYQSLLFNRHSLPRSVLVFYGGGNVILNGLNFYWFTRMIKALQRRMGPAPRKAPA